MKKIGGILLGTFVLAGMIMPEQALAQQNKNWVVCGGNWFNTCASVDVTVGGLVTDASSRLVTLRVMNLSGMDGTYGGSVFTKIGFFNIGGPASAALGSLSMSGDQILGDSDWRLNAKGDGPDEWVLADVNNAGGIELDLTTASGTNSSVRNGIANQCLPGALPGGTNAFWWNDCYTELATVNFADYTEIRFNVTGSWDLASTEVLIQAQNGPDGLSAQCITGAEGNCSVVPEPITMVLLGTGLAGLGGASYARRRREDEDEELPVA